MKNLVSFLFAAFAAMFIASCNNEAIEVEDGAQVSSVARYFEHKEFRPEAEIQGTTLAVICDNVAHFYQKMSDKTSQNEKVVCYVVTNTFKYFIPEFVGYKVIGNTYPVNKDGIATVENKQCSFTFTSCEVEDIVYMGENYKSEAPQCKAFVESITFNPDSTVTVLLNGERETITGIIPVTYVTEEKPVTLVRIDTTFTHNAFVPNATVSGHDMAVICNNTATFQKVWSNGTKDDAANVGYKWTNNFTVSYNSNMSVDDKSAVLGRHNLNNGTVTVAGYMFTVTYKNRACDDIMYNNKNYKQYAPDCKATAVAINIAENGLTVICDGEGETVTGDFPLSVTEKPHDPDFVGKILFGYATDSYVNGTNMATWEGCYLHFGVLYNGSYTVYSRKVGTNDAWRETSVSADYVKNISDSRPAAFIGNTAGEGYYIGYTKWWDQGSWCKIAYFTLGREADPERYLSSFNSTIKGENPNSYRMPLRGIWSNGKITVKVNDTETVTYTITGTED